MISLRWLPRNVWPILLINPHSRSWVAFAFAASWYLGNPSRVQRKQQTYLKGLTKTAPRRSNCSADRYFNWTQRGRRQANKSNTATENVSQSFSLVKLVFPPPPQVERLTAACWSCTCFFFFPQPSLGIPIKVVAFFSSAAQYPVFGHEDGGKRTRWDLFR